MKGMAPEADEGFVEMPAIQRKLSIVQGKIWFNGKILDPTILKKKEWELSGEGKYQKGILEHVHNKLQQEASKNPTVKKFWEDNKNDGFEGYASFDALKDEKEDKKDEEEGVIGFQWPRR